MSNLKLLPLILAMISALQLAHGLELRRMSASLLLALSPLGNLQEAGKAVLKNVESITCTLDEQNSDDSHSSCQLLDQIVRWRGGKFLIINQNWGGSASTGASVWEGANMASWYLENVVGNDLRGKSLVELGAGVGFTSLVANALGAGEVVTTDGNEDVLKLADDNIRINADPLDKNHIIRTAQLRWSTDDEKAFVEKHWDYIIASDVTYRKSSWTDLIGTIRRLSSPGTIAILSMEPRNVGEVEGVLAEARRQGIDWSEETLPIDREKTLCGMTCARLFLLRLSQ